MSKLLENALISIRLGIEDYQSEEEGRPISATRNIFAGVLLLGKECLIRNAPKAEIWEVLAVNYVPKPDGEGGVNIEPKPTRTIDLHGIKRRFRDFDLDWPIVSQNFDVLQDLRNNLEHFYSEHSKEQMQQVIASSFPLIKGFLDILEINPEEMLKDVWQIMIQETELFQALLSECNDSFSELPWNVSIDHLEKVQCPNCSSSLIYQIDDENDDPISIEGKCKSCGHNLTAEETVKIIVHVMHGFENYRAVKHGDDYIINDCPECYQPTYIHNYDINMCYYCGYEVSGSCNDCGEELTAANQSTNNSSVCYFCYARWEKIMNE